MLRKIKKNTLFYDWNYSQYYGFRSPWTLGSLSWSAMRMWYLDELVYRYNVFTNSTYRYFLISYHKFYAVFVCTDSVFISMGKYILTPPQPHTIFMTCIVGRLHQLSNVTCWIMYSFINMFIFFNLVWLNLYYRKWYVNIRHLLLTTFTQITN